VLLQGKRLARQRLGSFDSPAEICLLPDFPHQNLSYARSTGSEFFLLDSFFPCR
jgi:hypothetical protein